MSASRLMRAVPLPEQAILAGYELADRAALKTRKLWPWYRLMSDMTSGEYTFGYARTISSHELRARLLQLAVFGAKPVPRLLRRALLSAA